MYTVLPLKDLAELKTRRGTSANTTAATIMGPTFPTTEAYTVYVWNDSSTDTPDDDEIVQPTVGASNGRWFKVDIDTSAVNLSVYYTKLDLETSGDAEVHWDNVTNAPNFLTSQEKADWTSNSGASEILNKPTLSTVATSGSYNDLTNKPTIPSAQVNSDWTSSSGVSQILNKPTLATVATSGAYTDLSGRPSLATVATSGSYTDLSDKPTIPSAQIQSDWNQTNTGSLDYIKNKPTRTITSVTKTLNSNFQPSSTYDVFASYSVKVTATVSLSGAQTGTVFLETSVDGSTNWVVIAQSELTWGGTLVIGLSLSMANTQTVSGFIPKNYFARIRTSGTATMTYQSGQEVQM